MKYVVWLFLAAIVFVPAHAQQLVQNDPLEEFLNLHQVRTAQSFDNSFLNGTYAYFSVAGVTPPTYSTELCSTMGVWSFNGKGLYTTARSLHCTRQPNNTRTFNGTYAVQSSGRVTFFSPGKPTIEGILTDDGAGFVWYNSTTNGLVEAGYGRKMR